MRKCCQCVALFAAICGLLASSEPSYWRHFATHPQSSYSRHHLNLHNDTEVLSLFSSYELNEFNAVVTSFLNTPTSQMWTPVDSISEDKPFIFYHQRKAGGTSIRGTLAETAHKENFTTYIPCYPPVACDTFSFPYNKKYALYAGHFQWGSLDESARMNSTFRSGMSCASNFREPIRRVESCLYFRFRSLLTARNATCVDDLSLEDFVSILFQYDEYGQGCFNEPFRILSGFQDETVVNHLMGLPAHPPGVSPREKVDPDVLAFILKATLDHIRRCPPTVLEIPQSFDAMINRSPIFTKHDSFTADTVLNANKHSCAKLSGDKLAIVKRYTALEMILYDAVFRKTAQRVAEEDPAHYLFRMACSRQRHYQHHQIDVVPTSSVNSSVLVPALLVSGEDNDSSIFLRESLEFATGRSTGGIFGSDREKAVFVGEESCSRNRVAVHVPAAHVSMEHSPRGTTVLRLLPKEPKSTNVTACHLNGLASFARAVIMLRDPFVELFNWIQTLPSYDTMTAPELAVTLKQLLKQESIANSSMTALYQSRYRWLMEESMFHALFESNVKAEFSKTGPVKRKFLRKTGTPVVHRFPTDQFLFVSPEALLISANGLFLVHNSHYNSQYNDTLDRVAWASSSSSSSSSSFGDKNLSSESHFLSHQSSDKTTEMENEPVAVSQRSRRKSSSGWLGSLNHLGARSRRGLSDAAPITADTAFPTLPPHLLSLSSLNDEPSTNLSLRSNALLRYVTFVGSHHGEKGDVTDDMLQRLSCTYANIQLRRPLRDKVHGIEAMAMYFKARPALLKVVTAEVMEALSALGIPVHNALFAYKAYDK